MSERIHGLAQFLPDKNSFEDCSSEELQHIIKRFPYFAPAHFLLLQKLKENGSPEYDTQQRKAALYFHDPLLFDYFISADKFLMKEADFGLAEQPETIGHQMMGEAQSFNKEAAPLATEQDILDHSEAAPETGGDQQEQELALPATVQSSTEAVPPLTEPDTVKEADEVEAAEPSVLPVSPLQENQQPVAEDERLDVAPAEQVQEDKQVVLAPPSALVAVDDENKSLVASNGLKEQKPVSAATVGDPLVFEPFHTVDYFASQGIKISSEGLPKDKLSQQLRSFTEWLKIMKRLPAAEIEANPQTNAEKTVENLASHSVKGSDVVTEAMAEVWARQGNKGKAIETYNKLSLLNPSKKAYFAAKIENLSGT